MGLWAEMLYHRRSSEFATVPRHEEADMSMPFDSTQPGTLPAAEIVVEINRDTGRILARKAQIRCASDERALDAHQQVCWTMRSGLLPDELVLIFGKPLDWSGPVGPGPERLPLVENPFCGPFALCRGRSRVWSGRPRLEFPPNTHAVAWMYGIILVRGQDTPVMGDSHVEIVRA
jgi:hypothetical protein